MKEIINPEIFANVGLTIMGLAFIVFFISIYLSDKKYEKLSRKQNEEYERIHRS